MPHSTLGYERRFNWAFNAKSEDEFVANVLAGQPDPPPYFAMMKRVNKEGPRDPRRSHAPPLSDDALAGDDRERRTGDRYAAGRGVCRGHVPGTLNIPMNGSFVTWAGWLIPYDTRLLSDRR